MLASAAIAGLVAALFAAVLITVSEVRDVGAETRHHEATLVAVDRMERHLSELASGITGFTLTGNTAFRAHWERGLRTLPHDLAAIERLTKDDPSERPAVLTLRVQTGLYLSDYGARRIWRAERDPRPVRVAAVMAARRQAYATLTTIGRLRNQEQTQALLRQRQLEDANRRTAYLGGAGLLASVLLIAALGVYLVRRIAAPVRAIAPVAARLQRGDLAARVVPAGHPDVRVVAEAFNAMAGELERERAALETALAEVRHLADHDALTGLLNRRSIAGQLERHCAEVARYGSRGAVILLDVDRFKAINDGFGHATGDEVIVWIADILRGRLRASDQLARLGGDEFAILIPVGGREEAELVADTLVRAVRAESATPRGGCPGGLTVSVGVAAFEGRDDPTPEAMLSDADWAMYDAKAAGRDGYAIAEPRAAAVAR